MAALAVLVNPPEAVSLECAERAFNLTRFSLSTLCRSGLQWLSHPFRPYRGPFTVACCLGLRNPFPFAMCALSPFVERSKGLERNKVGQCVIL